MRKPQNLPTNQSGFNYSAEENKACENSQLVNNEVKTEPKIIQIPGDGIIKSSAENFLVSSLNTQITKKPSSCSVHNNLETEISQSAYQYPKDLFRLFVKNGEFVYARPNDIVMLESCDHLVKVYVAFNDKMKKTIRHSTLKSFLFQLPREQFLRIGRFCAVNTYRLSGGNFNEQIFEFDFKISIKLRHPIPQSAFGNIGK